MPPQFHGKQPPPPPQPQPQGGTYGQDQMNLQNLFSNSLWPQPQPQPPVHPKEEAARKRTERYRENADREFDRRAEVARRIRERRNPRKAPQPREPQIDITQEDGFGGIWNQPKPPPPPPPPPQPWRPKWTSGHTYVKDPLSVLPPSRGGTGPPTGWGLKQRSGTQYVKGVGRAPQQSGGISGQQQGIGQQQQTPTQGGPGGY